MKANILHRFIVNRLKAVEGNLSAYLKNRRPRHLHKLRVNIKKIKAVFSFAETVYKKKYDAAKLNPLFQRAGKIRELQIYRQLLSVLPNSPDRLIDKLKDKENILIRQFIKNTLRSAQFIRSFSESVSLPKQLPDEKIIKKYFKKEERKTKKIFLKRERESMHQYRIKIKAMMYVYGVLPKRIKSKIELNESKVNKQQLKLGEWHDTYAAINFLTLEHLPKNAVDYILKLEEKERRQFNALFIE